MYADQVNRIIKDNKIDIEEFNQKLSKTLILGIFEAICKDIKKYNKKIEEKERYRKNPDKLSAIKMLVRRYANCILSDEEYEVLQEYFNAYFSKDNRRKIFDNSYKLQLLKKQDAKCSICNKHISIDCSHLDHIIPWEYVGDELKNNYQMLCDTCNLRKGSSTYFEISMTLLNKSEDLYDNLLS